MGVPEKVKSVIYREIQGEIVLLDPEKGKYFGLNSTGASFWDKVDGSKTVNEIVSLMAEEYDVQRDVLAVDVEELVRVLVENGLLIMS